MRARSSAALSSQKNLEVRKRRNSKKSIAVRMKIRWFKNVERMLEERITKQIYKADVQECRETINDIS